MCWISIANVYILDIMCIGYLLLCTGMLMCIGYEMGYEVCRISIDMCIVNICNNMYIYRDIYIIFFKRLTFNIGSLRTNVKKTFSVGSKELIFKAYF